jgi:hypothetical protein
MWSLRCGLRGERRIRCRPFIEIGLLDVHLEPF